MDDRELCEKALEAEERHSELLLKQYLEALEAVAATARGVVAWRQEHDSPVGRALRENLADALNRLDALVGAPAAMSNQSG